MLSLKQIELHNFRGIRNTLVWQFHSQPGLYFVQGHNLKEPTLGANGAGKSTIFVDGPYWILTGKTIMSQRPGSSIENWELDRGTTYGELTLVIDTADYVIRRGRNPSLLSINQRSVEQHEIDKLIPLSDSVLRRTLLIGQRSSMFLDLRPEEKSRVFSETLDLDIWLRAADLAGETLREQERESTKIVAQFSRVAGSINEVRDQHEAALGKEAEFEEQHAARLDQLKQLGNEEMRRFDMLSEALRSAQERIKPTAQSSTSEDELRNHRAAERALRDSVVKLDSELSRVTRESSQLQHQIDSYQAAICPECGQKLPDEAHTHQRQQDLLELQQKTTQMLEEIPKSITELKDKIGDSELLGAILEQKFQEDRELQGEITSLQTQITAQERAVIRITNDIKQAESEINPYSKLCDDLEERYKTLNEQYKVLEQQDAQNQRDIEILKFWQKGYRDIRLQQIDSTLLELELATNRNAAALGLQDWEIQFATERETKSGTASQVFSIFLFPPGQTKPISWDSYSGGEAQRWQLAVTFGLSEVLLSRAGIDVDWEILDEPTGFLSQEGIDDLLECLHARAHELQRRVYLIDHRSLERGSFDGIVTVVKDTSGVRIDNAA